MEKSIITSGKTIDLAIESALSQLGLDRDSVSVTVLQQPLDKIYLAATSAMSLFAAVDALDHIRLTGTRESGWYIDAAVEAMQRGDIEFAGKYS